MFGDSDGLYTEHGFNSAREALAFAKQHVRTKYGRGWIVRKARDEMLYNVSHHGKVYGSITIYNGIHSQQRVCA